MNKFYAMEDYLNFHEQHNLDPSLFMVSTGISEADYDHLKNILDVIQCDWICIDIANGYIQKFVEFCKKSAKNIRIKLLLLVILRLEK